MGIEALLLSQVITITGSTGQVVTKQSDGSLALEDAAGGGLDNLTEAFATASPNNVVNNVSLTATGPTTNVSVAIVPKGTGAFSLSVPDGTAAGGNARGANAVDLQTFRTNAGFVASGQHSVIGGGLNNYSNGGWNVIGGGNSNITDQGYATVGGGERNHALAAGATVSGGESNVANSGWGSVSGGAGNHTTANFAWVGGGWEALADRHGMHAHSAGPFATRGDSQRCIFVARNKTTSATPATLFLDGSSTQLTIPDGKILAFTARITGIKSDGTAVADYVRSGRIKRIDATTSLVGSIETIGTDHEDNALTNVSITADDTNDALDISVTGIAGETWRWVAVVEGLEIGYGT